MLLPIELIRYTLDWVPDLDPDIKRQLGLIKKIDINKFKEIKRVCRVFSGEAKNTFTGIKADIYKLPYYELESSVWNIKGCLILNIVKRNSTVFGNASTGFSTIKNVCNCNPNTPMTCPLHICSAN